MENIKVGMQVKYIGETNNWTFKNDLSKNSLGTVKNIFESDGITTYHVEFKNGIETPINSEELKELN